MSKVFISGSISIKKLPILVRNSLDIIIQKNIQVLIGDADGVDLLIQEYLKQKSYFNTVIYSIYSSPRNLASKEFKTKYIEVSDRIKKERERQEYKDRKMTEDSDFSLIVWDGLSKGSFKNILRAIDMNKKSRVYLKELESYLPNEKITAPDIELIFHQNNGYSASETVNLLKKKNIDVFDRTQDLNKFLIDRKIILRDNNNSYKPHPELNEQNVKNFFKLDSYRGRSKNIKFTNNFIDWLENEVRKQMQPEQQNLL